MAKVKDVIFDLKFKVGEGEARLSTFSKRLEEAQKKLEGAKEGTVEFIEAQKELDQINRELDQNFGGLDKRTSSYTNTVKKAGRAIGGLLAIGGVTAIMKDGISTIIEFDDALKDLSAITGATGGDLEFYEQQAKGVGATSTISAAKAVEAFKLIGSARPELLKSKESLALVTKEAIILAEAARLDLPEAATALTSVMNQFAVPAENARQIIDALAAGSVSGAADIATITETIERSGTVLAQNNVTFQEAIGLTETLAKNELKGADAGTALRGVILKLTNAGKGFVDGQFNVIEALKQVKGEFDAIEDPVERANAMFKLFQAEGVTAGGILLENIGTLEDFTAAVSESGTALEQQATQNSTVSAALARVRNNWDNVILRFSKSSGLMSRVLNSLADNLGNIVNAIGFGVAAFVALRIAIAATTARTRIYGLAAKLSAAYQGLFTGATNASTIKFRVFNTVIKANPLVLLGTLLISAIGFLYDFASAEDDVADSVAGANSELEKQTRIIRNNRIELDLLLGQLADGGDVNLSEIVKFSKEDITGVINSLKAEVEQQLSLLSLDQIPFQIFKPDETDLEFANRIAAEADIIFGTATKESIKFSNEISNVRSQLREIFRLEQELSRRQSKLDAENNRQKDSKKKNDSDIRERERHAVAIANIEGASADEILDIKIDYANKYLAELKANQDTEAKQIRKQNNLIEELNLQREKAANVSRIKAQLEEVQAQILRGDIPPSTAFEEILKRYADLTFELADAQGKAFNPTDGSIEALSARAKQLGELATKADQGADSFDDLVVSLIKAQKELEQAQSALKPIDFEKLYNEDLSEFERHQLALNSLQEDGEIERVNIMIAFAKARLKVLEEFGKLETLEAEKLNNKIEELEAEKGKIKEDSQKKDAELEKEKNEQILAGIEEVLQATFEAFNTLIELKNAEVDNLISLQQTRVDEAREIADQGNAEVLEAEEARLDALNKKREDFVRKQQALAAAQMISEAALAIVKAAAEGGAAAPFTIAATLIALAAGLAQARAVATQAAFFKGGYTGDGNPHDESLALGRKPYTYHKGEFVMDHVSTKIGDNRRILQDVLDHRLDLGALMSSKGQTIMMYSGGFEATYKDEIVDAIKNQPRVEWNISERGILTMVERQKNKKKKFEKRLK